VAERSQQAEPGTEAERAAQGDAVPQRRGVGEQAQPAGKLGMTFLERFTGRYMLPPKGTVGF
jgi:hypothetical protein